ncbi:MAG: GGDEF domain-containing protein, partial [Burkholderiaceae bacterium]
MTESVDEHERSIAAELARAERWAREGRVDEALAACRALVLKLDGERGRLAAELLLHRREPDRRAATSGPAGEAPSDPGADPLTGLPTRRQLAVAVARLADRLPDAPLTLLLVEVDPFPLDGGEPLAVGDAVLRAIAALLRAQSRPHDLLARVGAPTFVVAFGSPVSLTRATLVAERLREAIERHDWPQIRAGLRVTASIGVAACAAGESLDVALARAGAALGEGRRVGRNQVRG